MPRAAVVRASGASKSVTPPPPMSASVREAIKQSPAPQTKAALKTVSFRTALPASLQQQQQQQQLRPAAANTVAVVAVAPQADAAAVAAVGTPQQAAVAAGSDSSSGAAAADSTKSSSDADAAAAVADTAIASEATADSGVLLPLRRPRNFSDNSATASASMTPVDAATADTAAAAATANGHTLGRFEVTSISVIDVDDDEMSVAEVVEVACSTPKEAEQMHEELFDAPSPGTVELEFAPKGVPSPRYAEEAEEL
jgi:hypothetical protein